MSQYDSGPDGAPILIVGEAYGSDEARLKQPFVGQSGELLRQVLRNAGFNCCLPSECEHNKAANLSGEVKFTNLVNKQPEGNKFDSFTEGEVKNGIRELNDYISRWKSQIKVCIAVGAIPLQYLAGKYGIDKWRGSVIEVDGLTILPTFHPAYILRVRTDYPVFAQDIGRAYKIARSGYQRPTFNLSVDPQNLEECLYEVKQSKVCTIDIETVKHTNRIISCAVSTSRNRAICVPNRSPDSLDPEFRRFFTEILEDEGIEKVFHNGIFDVEILHNNFIETKNFKHDTMVMQHILAPELPKDLGFITSIYTDIPYYKDRGRMALPDNEKGWGKLKDEDKMTVYEYNCLDTCATFWCYEEMLKEILEDECYSMTYPQEMAQHEVAFELTRNGMLRDETRRGEISAAVKQKYVSDQSVLNAIVGAYVNVGSAPAKKKLLYETWKLPERTNKQQKISTDEDAIVSLIGYVKDYISGLRTESAKYEWQKKLAGLMLILKIQGYRKLLSSYIDISISSDGRIRSFYKPTGAETGRWSCDKYLDDTGLNGQTMPREVLEI